MYEVGTLFVGKTNLEEKISTILFESNNEELIERFNHLGIILVDYAHKFPYLDCQDWAFGNLGLPEYSFVFAGSIQQDLINAKIPELKKTTQIIDGALVAYLKKQQDIEKQKPYNHYGILSVVNGQPFVVSKWGRSTATDIEKTHIFKHPLFGYDFFGNYVDFYQKVDKN